MTLDITFYKENTDPESEATIALSEDFFLWAMATTSQYNLC